MRLGNARPEAAEKNLFHFRAGRDRVERGEANASTHINIVGHYAPTTLIDKNGHLIKVIALDGIDIFTQSDETLDAYKNKLNSLLKGFNSEYALYFWTLRRNVSDCPSGTFPGGFAAQFDLRYKENIKQAQLYANTLYLAIVTKPPEGLILKGLHLFKRLSLSADKAAQRAYLKKQHDELETITRRVVKALDDYGPTVLGEYQEKGVSFSQPLEFIGQLLNFDKQSVPLAMQDYAAALPRKRLFFNRRSGTIELRAGDGRSQFAAVLAIKEYAPVTYQGIFRELSLLRIPYVMAQSFRFYERQIAKGRLRLQQKDRLQSSEESWSQTEELNQAFDEAASGSVGYGAHHFNLICYADTQDELNHHVGMLIARFADLDIACVREDIASESSFWAQLPGNFAYIARQADISTRNMSALASLYNPPSGKLSGNYWGPAVTVLETVVGSPYYFNFHYRDVGNFLVKGKMGSGKTALIGSLLVQSMKFGGKTVLFDRERGLELLVRSLDGVYERLRPGIATGLNPCQLEDTIENRKFLSLLFRKILTPADRPLDEAEGQVIEQAIEGMYRLDQADRQFSHIASLFGAARPGSLRARFEPWHSGRENAWLFDNPVDSFHYAADMIGIDLTFILDDPLYKVPALMYLLYRFSESMEGKRGVIFIDEGQKPLEDDYFRDVINDLSRSPRKKNNLFGLATQAASDADSSFYDSLRKAAACQFFFPDPGADRSTYIDKFGLTEREYELVKTLSDEGHYCLLKYGYGKESVVVRACLEGLDDELAVISGRTENIKLVEKIREEIGPKAKDWLPVFQARRRRESNV